MAVVDKNVDKHGTRAVAEAYLKYLYTPTRARRSPPSNYYRPRDAGGRREVRERSFPKLKLFTIDEVFGGWTKAQKTHFADGGIFDQIYQPGMSAGEPRGAARMAAATRDAAASCPGFGLTLGFTLTYLSADRADPAGRRWSCKTSALGWARVLAGASPRRARWPPTG